MNKVNTAKKQEPEEAQYLYAINKEQDDNARKVQRIRGYNLFHTIDDYVFGELSKSKAVVLCSYLVFLTLLEILAYVFHGAFSILASRVWLLSGVACFFIILAYFVKAMVLDLRKKEFLSIILMLLLIAFLFIITGDLSLTEINPDATQQAAAGLDSFKIGDWNYTGKAFLGYPNRQYILAALPALLFGRSIITLHLGFAIPFIMGMLIFYCGLRKWANYYKINTNIAVLPLFALFVFPFVTEYYANFEQAIYPISFTMNTIGFFLLLLCKPDMANVTGIAWTGCMLSNSYTPALATLGLLLVFIMLSVVALVMKPDLMPFPIKNRIVTSKLLLLTEANIAIYFIATLFNKRQDRITQLRSKENILKLSVKSILDFLTDNNAIFLGMFGVVVIIYLIAGLTYRLKFHDFLISLWILGVFAVSDLLTGYISYQPAWIMQRALITIPVVITGVTLTAFQMIHKHKLRMNRASIIIIATAFAFLGYHNFQRINQSFVYFNYIQPMKYLLEDLEDTAKENGLDSQSEFNLVMYTHNYMIKNASDYCKFFYPNVTVYYADYGMFPSDVDTSKDVIVYWDDAQAEGIPIVAEKNIMVYDKRHDLEITWFRAVMKNPK